jgi:hypothetical protein
MTHTESGVGIFVCLGGGKSIATGAVVGIFGTLNVIMLACTHHHGFVAVEQSL